MATEPFTVEDVYAGEVEIGSAAEEQYWIDIRSENCLEFKDLTTDGILFENLDEDGETFADIEMEREKFEELVEEGILVYSPIDRNEVVELLSEQEYGDEYIEEGEHMDGYAYWQNFNELDDVKRDYVKFEALTEEMQ